MAKQKFSFGEKRRYINLNSKCDCAFTVGGTSAHHWANYRLSCAAELLW